MQSGSMTSLTTINIVLGALGGGVTTFFLGGGVPPKWPVCSTTSQGSLQCSSGSLAGFKLASKEREKGVCAILKLSYNIPMHCHILCA